MNRDVGFGLFFVLAGTVFLFDALEVIDLRGAYIWPVVLIGLGLAVILGGRRTDAEPEPEPDDDHEAEPPAHHEESPPPPKDAPPPDHEDG